MPAFSIDTAYVARTLADLVRIDSVNPELAPDGAGEAGVAAYLADAFRALGLDVDVHEPAPGRPNVTGRRKGAGTGRSLMLNAHTDTVGVEDMEAPFGAEVRDGRLYGRGSQDMKGGLVAALAAVRALHDAGVRLEGDLLLAAVVDEEHGSIGTEALVRRYVTDGAVVTEPTDLELCLAHKGFVWLEVETLGRAAHGSRPDEGVDANIRMGRFLAELDVLERNLRAREPHSLLGTPSLHAALLRGGTAPSVYAARSILQMERRTLPGESAFAAREEVQALIDRLSGADSSFRATVRVLFERRPFETSADGPLARTVSDAAAGILGRRPPVAGQTYWTDAALLADAGIETVVMGPVGAGLHTREEWVDLASVARLAETLAETACRYCGVAGEQP